MVLALPRGRRCGTWLLPALAVALLAPPAVTASAAAQPRAAAAKTRARIYHAFNRRGHSVFRARARSGSCFTVSLTTQRRDAWRCSTKSLIYDPCFSSSKVRGIVLCPDGPWAGTGVRMTLTDALPDRAGLGRAPSTRLEPWALETVDGRRCLLASGATNVVQEQRLNYFCGRRRDALWGSPDRSSQPWTIFSAPPSAMQLTKRAGIRTAWM